MHMACMNISCHFLVKSTLLLVPGGVLRYISDGDVRSPFLGLKFAI